MGHPGLTDLQVEEFTVVFEHFDKDGSGAIDSEELGKVLEEFGQKCNAEELQDIIEEVDEDNNGEIDIGEFLSMMVMYSAKSKDAAKLATPDGDSVKVELQQKVDEVKQELLSSVEKFILDQVGVPSAMAIRSLSAKSFFKDRLEFGTSNVLEMLGESFDKMNQDVIKIIDAKDAKSKNAVQASRAQSFVEAANAVMKQKREARNEKLDLEANAAAEAEQLKQDAADQEEYLKQTALENETSLKAAAAEKEASLRSDAHEKETSAAMKLANEQANTMAAMNEAQRQLDAEGRAAKQKEMNIQQLEATGRKAEDDIARRRASNEKLRTGVGDLKSQLMDANMALSKEKKGAMKLTQQVGTLTEENRGLRQANDMKDERLANAHAAHTVLLNAKDHYNVVMLDSRVQNPQALATDKKELELLKSITDPVVVLGKKYEICVEELSSLRKERAGLVLEKKNSKGWKDVPAQAEKQNNDKLAVQIDELRNSVGVLQARLAQEGKEVCVTLRALPQYGGNGNGGRVKSIKISSPKSRKGQGQPSPVKPDGPNSSKPSPRRSVANKGALEEEALRIAGEGDADY